MRNTSFKKCSRLFWGTWIRKGYGLSGGANGMIMKYFVSYMELSINCRFTKFLSIFIIFHGLQENALSIQVANPPSDTSQIQGLVSMQKGLLDLSSPRGTVGLRIGKMGQFFAGFSRDKLKNLEPLQSRLSYCFLNNLVLINHCQYQFVAKTCTVSPQPGQQISHISNIAR